MPSPLQWPAADAHLVGTHWAYDLGAWELTEELSEASQCAAVLANFSRLVVDPNRPLDSPTLFRNIAEGQPVVLNQDLSAADRELRIAEFYRPYHDAVDRAVAQSSAPQLFSVHTFTPVYEGQPRSMEIGVLFDRHEAEARALADALSAAGYGVALNEPYSGKEGLIYSVDLHAQKHGRVALEIEVRQDLAVDPAYRKRLVAVLVQHLT